MTPAQLEVVIAVAETRGFTAAADVLSMTQSGVSHAVAALEAELGTRLVERDRTRGATLTGVGERVVGHARQALACLERIRQEAAAWQGLDVGTIRLGAFASAATRVLPGLLRAYAEHHPGVEVVVQEGTDDEVRQWILVRAVDVGFVTLPAAGLHVVEVARDEMLAVLPAGHPLASHPRLDPATLGKQPFIMSAGGCEPLIRAIFATAGIAPTVRSAFRDVATILAMVGEGLGVSIVPELSLPRQSPGIVTLPLAPPAIRRLGLAVRSREEAPPAVTALLQLAAPALDCGCGSGPR